MTGLPAASGRASARWLAPLLLLAVLFGWLRLGHLTAPLVGIDEAIYAVVGDRLNQGDRLYADIWDHKPPPVYLLHALILRLHRSLTAVHAAMLLAGLLSLALLTTLARRAWGTGPALAAGWLFTCFTAGAWAFSNTETVLVPLQLAALLPWLGRDPRPGPVRAGASGFAFGLGVAIKPVVALPAAAVGLLLLGRARQTGGNPGLVRRAAWLMAGGVAGLLPAVLPPFWDGTWTLFLATNLDYNAGYITAEAWSILMVYGLDALGRFFTEQWPLWGLGAAGLLAALAANRRPPADPAACLLAVWTVTSLAAALAPLKYLDHYFLLVVPGLCLFAGRLLRARPSASRWTRLAGPALLGLAGVVPLAFSGVTGGLEAVARLSQPPPPTAAAEIGRALRDRTAPDERVFLWRTFEADAYFHADRPVAGPTFLWFHLLRPPLPPGEPERFMARWRADPPRYVVVGQSPIYAERSLPELEAALAADYRFEDEVAGHRFYRRRD